MVILEMTTERRQQAREPLIFPPEMVRYINWESVGQTRAELACDVHVTTQGDGSVRIEWTWAYTEGA